MPGRPAVPLPPERMPLVRGGRPRKRWRWVGIFTPDVLLCVARAWVGPLPVSWAAAYERANGTLVETFHRGPGPAVLERGRLRMRDGPLAADLALAEGVGVETVSPHGAQYAWTRKQGGVVARGTVAVGGHVHAVAGPCAIVDESAGYHARHTAWRWSAGVGEARDGTPVAWNLVAGVHDARTASERTVWVAGVPHHVAPAAFAEDLTRVTTADGGDLAFTAQARRAHREELLLVASRYEQPFGAFAGVLPVAGPLRAGLGVMERHEARW